LLKSLWDLTVLFKYGKISNQIIEQLEKVDTFGMYGISDINIYSLSEFFFGMYHPSTTISLFYE
jgi:hypothetical protein